MEATFEEKKPGMREGSVRHRATPSKGRSSGKRGFLGFQGNRKRISPLLT